MPFADTAKRRQYSREWRAKHTESLNQSKREYYAANRDRILESRKQRWQTSPAVRIAHRAHCQKYNQTLRQAVLQHLGEVCARCGHADERALQIDHINGGGRLDRQGLSTQQFYKQVLQGRPGDKYQLLCANCNVVKKRENQETRKAVA